MNKQEEALNVMAGAIAGGPLVTTVECRAETPSRSKEGPVMDEGLKAIDPENCGCVDCCIGYSKPINFATPEELKALYKGNLINRSGSKIRKTVTYTYD